MKQPHQRKIADVEIDFPEADITTCVDAVKTEQIQYFINLDGPITEAYNYRPVFSTLQKAESRDIIILRVNSTGGQVDTAVQLINAIQTSRSKCIAEVYSAYSAASAIVLACDEIRPMKFCSMMIHALSLESSGKMGEIINHINFENRWAKNFFRRIYTGFLSELEIESVLLGVDLWLTEEEITKRLKKWKPLRDFSVR